MNENETKEMFFRYKGEDENAYKVFAAICKRYFKYLCVIGPVSFTDRDFAVCMTLYDIFIGMQKRETQDNG